MKSPNNEGERPKFSKLRTEQHEIPWDVQWKQVKLLPKGSRIHAKWAFFLIVEYKYYHHSQHEDKENIVKAREPNNLKCLGWSRVRELEGERPYIFFINKTIAFM